MSAKPTADDYNDQGVCYPCANGNHTGTNGTPGCYEYGCECPACHPEETQ